MDNKSEEHLAFESYKEQINLLYQTNNIIREKSELYYDFMRSLLTLIDETYLGSDIIQTKVDMSNHFNWCFNRVNENFEKERIFFTVLNSDYEHLWFFFHKGYYMCDNETKYKTLHEFFNALFDINTIKTQSEIDLFIEIYKIFDNNLKKIN